MYDFTKESCRDFIKALVSADPVPGGGGASALVGAIGLALGNMVGSLTLGKKKYAPVEPEILALKAKSAVLEKKLLDQVAADAEAFQPLAKAYRIPKNDPNRDAILENASLKACEVPLHIMELCCEAISLVKSFSEKGTRIALSDAGCGAVILKSALQAASLNVYINTKSMKNRAEAERLNAKCEALLKQGEADADAIYESVRSSYI